MHGWGWRWLADVLELYDSKRSRLAKLCCLRLSKHAYANNLKLAEVLSHIIYISFAAICGLFYSWISNLWRACVIEYNQRFAEYMALRDCARPFGDIHDRSL